MSKIIYTKKICRFKGTNGSCGFVKEKSYLLEIEDIESEISRGNVEYTVVIKSRGLSCIYSNMDKFLENWEVIG